MDVLPLGLCNSILKQAKQIRTVSSKSRIAVFVSTLTIHHFRLVQALHSIGIVHGELKSQDVVYILEGGFCLIDFSNLI
jgi:tRNA A-37 threonylcarbamoyl transferase component Bud32